MDAQSIYEMPSVSRCLVFVMLSIAALGGDRPQRRSMTTARQANLVHLTFDIKFNTKYNKNYNKRGIRLD